MVNVNEKMKEMRKIFGFIIFAIFMLTGMQSKADDIKFKASVPPSVAMGTQFRLSYVINTHKAKNLRIPPAVAENFDVLMGPSTSTSSSMRIVNGKRTSTVSATYTYILSAKKEGSFNIGPATIEVGNSEYKSNTLTVKVLPPNQAQPAQGGGNARQPSTTNQPASASDISSENIFLRVTASKRNVYEQEGLLLTFKLYTAYDIAGVESVKFPEFEGFLAQEIEQKDVQWTLENYNGRNLRAAVIKQTVLYPQRSGAITIGGAKAKAIVRVRNKQTRGSSFFDDFFDTYQDVPKTLTSPKVSINVKPLPSGKPASFSGAVGNFSLSSQINKTALKTNEAVTLKLTFKGNGNIKLLKTPEIKFPNDFEVYDPKINNNIRVTAAGSNGTKTIEYMAIPRYAGDFEIPSVRFSYFDTKTETYKTLSTDAYNLSVEKGEGGVGEAGNTPVISNYTNRENVKFLGEDIRYIKVKDVHFLSNKDIFFGSFMYIMSYVMIAVLFIVFFIIYRKQVKENANIALVRTKKANKMAVKRLKKAEKLLKENQREAFYEEVLRALWGYLSDKLNIPQSELTKENVATELSKNGVEEVLTNDFLEIINTCEFARYAPAGTSGAMDKLFNETIDAIGKMENTIKK